MARLLVGLTPHTQLSIWKETTWNIRNFPQETTTNKSKTAKETANIAGLKKKVERNSITQPACIVPYIISVLGGFGFHEIIYIYFNGTNNNHLWTNFFEFPPISWKAFLFNSFWEASTWNHCHSANSFVSDMSDRKMRPETIIWNAFLNQL